MTDALQTIRSIVADFLRVDCEEISPDANLVADLGLDSFAMMDLILTIESNFPGFDFAAPSVSEIVTLRQLAAHLDSHA